MIHRNHRVPPAFAIWRTIQSRVYDGMDQRNETRGLRECGWHRQERSWIDTLI